jgi:hypothetical protein
MTQLNDESALRAALADLTAGQPPAPPDRYAAVRRRAVLHRRRQLAGIAAAVAVLAAAAVTIPLSLHASPAPPTQSQNRHYRVSEQPPGPGAKRDLVATASIDGVPYELLLQRQPGLSGYFLSAGALGETGIDHPATPASRSGDPASFMATVGGTPQAEIATVRSDVAYLTVTYSNGQQVALRPVDVLGPKYAPFVVIVTPYPAAVVRVTAYSRTGEIGYAVPFTGAGSVAFSKWLGPGQPALPQPLIRLIGSGSMDGTRWNAHIAIGPWGTWLFSSSGGTTASWGWPGASAGLPRGAVVAGGGTEVAARNVYIYSGRASPEVAFLEITTKDGRTTRVPAVAAGAERYFAYADGPGHRVVRWAAYSAIGHRLAAGSGEVP